MAISAQAFMTERHDLITYTPGDPGVGNPLTWPIPAGVVVQIICVRFQLVSSVNVGNRLAIVFLNDAGAATGPASIGFIEQPPNKTWTYDFATGLAPIDHTANQQWLFQPLACCYQAKEGENLIINFNGIDALDQIQNAAIRCFVWKAD